MSLQIRKGSYWYQVGPDNLKVRRGNQWVTPVAVYVRVNGEWKAVWAPVYPTLIERYNPSITLQNTNDAYITPTSRPLVTKLVVKVAARVQGRVYAGWYGNQYWQTVTVKWGIDYRVNGGSWVRLRTDQYSKGEGSDILFPSPFHGTVERSYTFTFTPSPDETYEFRVIHLGESSTSGGYFEIDQREGTWVRVDSIEIHHDWVGKI